MRKCPKCGSTELYAYVTVVQRWAMDCSSVDKFDSIVDDYIDVADHWPGDSDDWECQKCHFSGNGSAFRAEEEKQSEV